MRDARAQDLLTDATIAELLRAEMARREERMARLRKFLDTADQLAAADPQLSPDEIMNVLKSVGGAAQS